MTYEPEGEKIYRLIAEVWKKKSDKKKLEKTRIRLDKELSVCFDEILRHLTAMKMQRLSSIEDVLKDWIKDSSKITRMLVKEREDYLLGLLISENKMSVQGCRELNLLAGEVSERVLEIPKTIQAFKSITSTGELRRLLDIGSALNRPSTINVLPDIFESICFFTESAEKEILKKRGGQISYQFGDADDLPFRDEYFSDISCVSTLEHVGFPNKNYGVENSEKLTKVERKDKVQNVINQVHRCLKANGTFVLSVPVSGSKKTKVTRSGNTSHSVFNLGEIKDLISDFSIKHECLFKKNRMGWSEVRDLTPERDFEVYFCECRKV